MKIDLIGLHPQSLEEFVNRLIDLPLVRESSAQVAAHF